jgi:sulfur relay (sulfurtransferase) DsrF/TusC family protein
MENNTGLEFYCDQARHIVCKPYSIDNLHKMAKFFGIKKCWFHKSHYDMPKRRRIELMTRCTIVTSKEIATIIALKNK